jgi:hypothetical protein
LRLNASAADLPDVLRERLARLHRQQRELGVRADDREQVVEVVRDAPGELADRVHLLHLEQLRLELLARGDVLHRADGVAGARRPGECLHRRGVAPHPADRLVGHEQPVLLLVRAALAQRRAPLGEDGADVVRMHARDPAGPASLGTRGLASVTSPAASDWKRPTGAVMLSDRYRSSLSRSAASARLRAVTSCIWERM